MGFICVVLLINFTTVNLRENLKIKEFILLFNVIFFSGRVVCKDKSVVYHSPNPYFLCKLKLLFKSINLINLGCLFYITVIALCHRAYLYVGCLHIMLRIKVMIPLSSPEDKQVVRQLCQEICYLWQDVASDCLRWQPFVLYVCLRIQWL